jgi:phosphatidylinositol glycan class C protein
MGDPPAAWRKALWCPQPFPDNHTDDNFLECLVINADVVHRSYRRVVWQSLAVAQQVSLAAAVAAVAYHLHQGTLAPAVLLAWEAALLAGGAVLLAALAPTGLRGTLRAAASAAGLLVLTAALSPVYATLTASISPDTVIACAAALLLAHLYLHDYAPPRRPPPWCPTGSDEGLNTASYSPSLAGSLGLACALCAAVLMASQAPSLPAVAALMALSVEIHILAPPLQHAAAERAPVLHAAFTAGAVAAAARLVGHASVVLLSALGCTLAGVTLLCPMWLVRIHKFKAQINGPWDQADPDLGALAAAAVAGRGGRTILKGI